MGKRRTNWSKWSAWWGRQRERTTGVNATDMVVRDEAQVDPREIVQIDGRVRLARPSHAGPEVHMVWQIVNRASPTSGNDIAHRLHARSCASCQKRSRRGGGARDALGVRHDAHAGPLEDRRRGAHEEQARVLRVPALAARVRLSPSPSAAHSRRWPGQADLERGRRRERRARRVRRRRVAVRRARVGGVERDVRERGHCRGVVRRSGRMSLSDHGGPG
jgi:hypothetical protein